MILRLTYKAILRTKSSTLNLATYSPLFLNISPSELIRLFLVGPLAPNLNSNNTNNGCDYIEQKLYYTAPGAIFQITAPVKNNITTP